MSKVMVDGLAQARAQLERLEAVRADPKRRDVFWKQENWENHFEEILRCEEERDRAFSEALDDALEEANSDRRVGIVEQWAEALTADRQWYQQRVSGLHGIDEGWEHLPVLTPLAREELFLHLHLLESRYYERCARMQQLVLESLEIRRQLQGKLPPGKWQKYWQQLKGLYQMEDKFYEKALRRASHEPLDMSEAVNQAHLRLRDFVDGSLPKAYDRRREWFEQMAILHHHLLKQSENQPTFDRNGLKTDQALLMGELMTQLPGASVIRAEKRPPIEQAMFREWVWLGIALVVGTVLLLLFFWWFGG
ncbi:MAG: hypothetical protein H0T73_05440 [Ardenticatenales bacterium]|nr:hypothetical protein [Ardenticatenales bacterium]